jgi:hypothetical protein
MIGGERLCVCVRERGKEGDREEEVLIRESDESSDESLMSQEERDISPI